jgi:CubicO group peptidase (beta-lactamase class C family)
LIEKITGQTYAEFLQQSIFLPLGMSDTGYDSHAAIIERRASGYIRGPTGLQNARYIDVSGAFAAGGLYSTTGDLLRWERALFGGKVLTPASLEEMLTPFKNGYAFGVSIRTIGGHRCVWHNGGIDGFNAAMAYYPEDKLVVIVLGNVNGVAPAEIEANVARVALGESCPPVRAN